MSRRAFVLHEMGHSPLWLRRGHTLAPTDSVRDSTPAPAAPSVIETAAEAPSAINITSAATASPAPTMPPPALLEPAAPTSGADSPALPAHGDWQALQRCVADCQRCALAATRQQVVVGRGSTQARVLIVGEAPGEQEDKQGLPFVGKAGQLLENMLAAAGIDSQQDVYICNVIKCRPPGNRNPAPDEIAHCHDYLRWQIDSLQPEMIVALGRFAAHTLLQTQAPISSLRRQVHQAYGKPLLVTFHPAYLLRSPAEKAKAWQDWSHVARLLPAS